MIGVMFGAACLGGADNAMPRSLIPCPVSVPDPSNRCHGSECDLSERPSRLPPPLALAEHHRADGGRSELDQRAAPSSFSYTIQPSKGFIPTRS
jgi:hypothetical protein